MWPLRMAHGTDVEIGACEACEAGTDDGGVAGIAGVVDVYCATVEGHQAMIRAVRLSC